jgi:hypothetical protein
MRQVYSYHSQRDDAAEGTEGMKRFTESTKWDDKWFRRLPADQKFGWLYLLDTCDAAGVVEIDQELAEFRIGMQVNWEGLLKDAGRRIEPIANGKHWLTGYIKFQYGKLSRECNAHRPAIASLEKHSLSGRVLEGSLDPSRKGPIQDKDKDKDKNKDLELELEGGCKGETNPQPLPTPFDEFWLRVPLKVGKLAAKSAYDHALKALKSRGQDHPHEFLLDRMTAFSRSPKADGEFCPHPSTWLNQGRYDDDPETWKDRASAKTSDPRGNLALRDRLLAANQESNRA